VTHYTPPFSILWFSFFLSRHFRLNVLQPLWWQVNKCSLLFKIPPSGKSAFWENDGNECDLNLILGLSMDADWRVIEPWGQNWPLVFCSSLFLSYTAGTCWCVCITYFTNWPCSHSYSFLNGPTLENKQANPSQERMAKTGLWHFVYIHNLCFFTIHPKINIFSLFSPPSPFTPKLIFFFFWKVIYSPNIFKEQTKYTSIQKLAVSVITFIQQCVFSLKNQWIDDNFLFTEES